MKSLLRFRNTSTTEQDMTAKPVFGIGRKALAIVLAYLMIPLGIGDLYAQEYPPPPPDQQYDQGPQQAYTPLSFDELDQLVAPIALYPDALVAQILAASTYPQEVSQAEQMVQQNPGVPPQELGEMANEQNWDPSVKSLVAFPSVLANLSQNYQWASALGNAYYNQPQDVMTAIQTMRARAYAAGDLRSNQYMAVDYVPNAIVIAPVNPEVVYVPWYNPWVVYGTPVVAWRGYYAPPRPSGVAFAVGVAIGFGLGIAVAHWSHWGWGYHNWGMGWHNRTVVYQRNVYISRSVVVINHGHYGHYDRNVAQRRYNENVARRAPVVFHPAAFNRGAVNHTTINRTTINRNNYNRTNNFSRTTTNRNTFNRTNNYRTNNARPTQTFNRTNNFNRNNVRTNPVNRPTPTYNRPQNRTQFNSPARTYNRTEQNRTQYNRPQPNFSRPQQNYSRPQPNFNRTENRAQYNRPQQNYSRPQNRPQARPQSRPAPRQESHPRPQENRDHGRR